MGEVELNVEGGDDLLGLKMFYERQRNATLSGLAIGFATSFYILSNGTYFAEAINYSFILSIVFVILLVWAHTKQKRFFIGIFWAGFFSSGLLFLEQTRPLLQALLAWQFLGVLELGLMLLGGVLITRS